MKALLCLFALTLAACASDAPAEPPAVAEDAPAVVASSEAAVPTAAPAPSADLPLVTVYKTPTCGCCSLWVDHLRENGFPVEVQDLDSVQPIKDQYGIPASLASCHTAVVDGYIVEGHVPAEDVMRLLEEQPEAAGLAVPGMPIGSPGMEVEGRPADTYDVLLVADGETTVFATH